MSIAYIVVFLISMLGLVGCLLLPFVWMYRILGRKGYRFPHFLFWLAPFGLVAAFIASIFAVAEFANDWLSMIDTTTIPGMLLFSLALYPLSLASGGLVALILWFVVPSRRRTGPRRVGFPYRGASRLLGAASVVVPTVTFFVLHRSIELALRLLSLLVAAASTCAFLAHRAALPSQEEAVRADARPPVLYLRPFNEEGHVFAELPRRAIDVLSQYFHSRSPDRNKLYQTFEEFFMDSVRTHLGTFVALGNPQDSLRPLGAARTYVPDEGWQEELKRLAAEARCILAPVSQSRNLRWELEYLRQVGLYEKLFILTPPSTSVPSNSRLARVNNFLIRFLVAGNTEKWKRMESVSWADFRAALAGWGYNLPDTDPGLGSVVAFDMAGNSVTLVQGAATAGEYVEAIAMRLS